ncbi:gamma-glutamylcyclotransferase [Halomonas vilamensis]|uniref:Gamma-glutamylcyclotransferase n=1 Tax=Vreelandella vilamensis TaxID=531309 RepID=A0ABU1H1V1_9GAMM|nr:gamma-glutamylcyclotransferase family protein [Halomonas vilamensis]MDR5898289.1 gamma-glutamylcyclotransferase [Halomonas vilamensis]
MTGVKRFAVLLLIVLVGITTWLWLTMLSPWLYDRPDHLPPIQSRPHQVFVYGTLTYAPVRFVVMGALGNPEPATLEDFTREGLDITAAPEEYIDGLRLTVTPEQLARLDRYERLGVRYERVKLPLADGTMAWVYRRLPESANMKSPIFDAMNIAMDTQKVFAQKETAQ